MNTIEAPIRVLELRRQEAYEAKSLTIELASRYRDPSHPEFLRTVPDHGRRLAEPVREALRGLRYQEQAPALVIRGYPVEDIVAGPTPQHWRDHTGDTVSELDFWLLLTTAQLGDPFGWSFLQDGRIVTDILPIRGMDSEQSGHASMAYQQLHVEDAYYDCRPDYLSLVCVRNPGAPTTVAPVTTDGLTADQVDALFQPRFQIRPDIEHTAGLGVSRPKTISVLSGDRRQPYVRLDPPFMSALPTDGVAQEAFDSFVKLLEANTIEFALRPGDVILIDNLRAVHGRRPFRARYDGSDRWLRRTTVTRDLRKSRAQRDDTDDRIIRRA